MLICVSKLICSSKETKYSAIYKNTGIIMLLLYKYLNVFCPISTNASTFTSIIHKSSKSGTPIGVLSMDWIWSHSHIYFFVVFPVSLDWSSKMLLLSQCSLDSSICLPTVLHFSLTVLFTETSAVTEFRKFFHDFSRVVASLLRTTA